nr:cell division protein [Uronema sp. CCAP 334/1]
MNVCSNILKMLLSLSLNKKFTRKKYWDRNRLQTNNPSIFFRDGETPRGPIILKGKTDVHFSILYSFKTNQLKLFFLLFKKTICTCNAVQTSVVDWHFTQSVESNQIGLWFNSIVKPLSTRKHWWILLPSQNFLFRLRWENNYNIFAGEKNIGPKNNWSQNINGSNFFSEKPLYFYCILPFVGCLGLIYSSSYKNWQNQKITIDFLGDFLNEKKVFLPTNLDKNPLLIENILKLKKTNRLTIFEDYLNYAKSFESTIFSKKNSIIDTENSIGTYAQNNVYKNYYISSNFFTNLNKVIGISNENLKDSFYNTKDWERSKLLYSWGNAQLFFLERSNLETKLKQTMPYQNFQFWWKKQTDVCFNNFSDYSFTNKLENSKNSNITSTTKNNLNLLQPNFRLLFSVWENYLFQKTSLDWVWHRIYFSDRIKHKNHFNIWKNFIENINYKMDFNSILNPSFKNYVQTQLVVKISNQKNPKHEDPKKIWVQFSQPKVLPFSKKLFSNNVSLPNNYLIKNKLLNHYKLKNLVTLKTKVEKLISFQFIENNKLSKDLYQKNILNSLPNNFLGGGLSNYFLGNNSSRRSSDSLFILINGDVRSTRYKFSQQKLFTNFKNSLTESDFKKRELNWYNLFGNYHLLNSFELPNNFLGKEFFWFTLKNYWDVRSFIFNNPSDSFLRFFNLDKNSEYWSTNQKRNPFKLFSDYVTAAFFMDTISYKFPEKLNRSYFFDFEGRVLNIFKKQENWVNAQLFFLGSNNFLGGNYRWGNDSEDGKTGTGFFLSHYRSNIKKLNFPILMSGSLQKKYFSDKTKFQKNLNQLYDTKERTIVTPKKIIGTPVTTKGVYSVYSVSPNLSFKSFTNPQSLNNSIKNNSASSQFPTFSYLTSFKLKNQVEMPVKTVKMPTQLSNQTNLSYFFQNENNNYSIFLDNYLFSGIKNEQLNWQLNNHKWKYLGNWSFYWNYFYKFYGSSLVVKPWNDLTFSPHKNKYSNIIVPFNFLNKLSNSLKAPFDHFISRSKLPDQNILFQKWHSKNKTGFFYKRITKLALKQNTLISNSLGSNSESNYKRIVSLLWGFRAKYKLDEVLQYQKSKYYQSKKAQQTAHQNLDQNSESNVSKQTLIKTLAKNRRYKRYISLDVLSTWLRNTLYFRNMSRKLVPIKKDTYFFNSRNNTFSFFETKQNLSYNSQKNIGLKHYFGDSPKKIHRPTIGKFSNFAKENWLLFEVKKSQKQNFFSSFEANPRSFLGSEKLVSEEFKNLNNSWGNAGGRWGNWENDLRRSFCRSIPKKYIDYSAKKFIKLKYRNLNQPIKTAYTTKKIFLSLTNFKKLKNVSSNLNSVFPKKNIAHNKFETSKSFKQYKKESKIFWRNPRKNKTNVKKSIIESNYVRETPYVIPSLDKKKNINFTNQRILSSSNQKNFFLSNFNKSLIFDLNFCDNLLKNFHNFFSNFVQNSFRYKKNLYYGDKIFLTQNPYSENVLINSTKLLGQKEFKNTLQKLVKPVNKIGSVHFRRVGETPYVFNNRGFFNLTEKSSYKNKKKELFRIKKSFAFNYTTFLFNSSSLASKMNFKFSFFKKISCFSNRQYSHIFSEKLQNRQNIKFQNSNNEYIDINTKFKNLSSSFVIWRNKFHRPRDYFLLSYMYIDYLGSLLNSIRSVVLGSLNPIETMSLEKNYLNSYHNTDRNLNDFFGQFITHKSSNKKLLERHFLWEQNSSLNQKYSFSKNNLIKPQWSFDLLYHLKKNNFALYQQLQEFASEQVNNLNQMSNFEKNLDIRKKHSAKLFSKQVHSKKLDGQINFLVPQKFNGLQYLENSLSRSVLLSYRSLTDSAISERFFVKNKNDIFMQNFDKATTVSSTFGSFDSAKQNKNYLIAKNNIQTSFKKVLLLKNQQKYISFLKNICDLKFNSNVKYRRKTGIFNSRILAKQNKIYNGIFLSQFQLGVANRLHNLSVKEVAFWFCSLLFQVCLVFSLFSHYKSSINLCFKTLYSSLFVLNKYFVYIKYRIKRLISYIYQSNFQTISENLNNLKTKFTIINLQFLKKFMGSNYPYLNDRKIGITPNHFFWGVHQTSSLFMTNMFFNLQSQKKVKNTQMSFRKTGNHSNTYKFSFEYNILGLFQYLKYKYRQLLQTPEKSSKIIVTPNSFLGENWENYFHPSNSLGGELRWNNSLGSNYFLGEKQRSLSSSSLDFKNALKLFGDNQNFFSDLNLVQKVKYISFVSEFVLNSKFLAHNKSSVNSINQNSFIKQELQEMIEESKENKIVKNWENYRSSLKLSNSTNFKTKFLKQKNLKVYFKVLQWNMLVTLLIGESELLAELEPYREMHWYFLKKFPIFLRTPSGNDYLGMVDYQADEKIRVIKQKIRQTIMILYLRSKKYESKLQNRSTQKNSGIPNPRKNKGEQALSGKQNKDKNQIQKNLKKKILRQKIQKISPWKSILTFLGKYSFMIRYTTLNKRFRESLMTFSQPLISFGPPGIIFFPYILKNFVSNFDNRSFYQKNLSKNTKLSSRNDVRSDEWSFPSFLLKNYWASFPNLIPKKLDTQLHPKKLLGPNYFSGEFDQKQFIHFFKSFKRQNLLLKSYPAKIEENEQSSFSESSVNLFQELNFQILQKLDLVNQTQKCSSSYKKDWKKTFPKKLLGRKEVQPLKLVGTFDLLENDRLQFPFEFLRTLQKLIKKYNIAYSALNISNKTVNFDLNQGTTKGSFPLNNFLANNFFGPPKNSWTQLFFWERRKERRMELSQFSQFPSTPLLGVFPTLQHFLTTKTQKRSLQFPLAPVKNYWGSFGNKNFYDWSFNQRSLISGKQSSYFDTFDPKLRYYRFSTNFSKVLSDVGGLNTNFSVHQDFGPLICKVYTGLFSKEFAKNYLLVSGNSISNSENILFLVQALAGEIGLKLFMEDAKRLQRIGNRGINKATKRLEKLFDIAQANVPALIFIEDIHVIGSKTKMIKVDEEQDDVEILARSLLSKLVYRKFHKTKSLRESYMDQHLFKGNSGSSLRRSLKPVNPIPKSLVLYQLTRRKSFSNFFKNQTNSYKRLPTKVFLRAKLSPTFTTNAVLIWKLFKSKIATPNKSIKETPWYHIPIDAMRSIHPLTYSIRVKVAKITLLAIFTMGTRLRLVKDLIKLFEKTNYNSHQNFIVFATTNKVSTLDPSLRRPGRLEETISLSSVTSFSSGSRSVTSMNTLNTFQILLKNVPGFSKTFNLIDNTLFSSNLQIKEWSLINYLAEDSYYSVLFKNGAFLGPKNYMAVNSLSNIVSPEKIKMRLTLNKNLLKNNQIIGKAGADETTYAKKIIWPNNFLGPKFKKFTNIGYNSKRKFNNFMKYQRMTSFETKNSDFSSGTTQGVSSTTFNYWQILFSNIIFQRKKGFFDVTYNLTLKNWVNAQLFFGRWRNYRSYFLNFSSSFEKNGTNKEKSSQLLGFDKTISLNLFLSLAYSRAGQNLMIKLPKDYTDFGTQFLPLNNFLANNFFESPFKIIGTKGVGETGVGETPGGVQIIKKIFDFDPINNLQLWSEEKNLMSKPQSSVPIANNIFYNHRKRVSSKTYFLRFFSSKIGELLFKNKIIWNDNTAINSVIKDVNSSNSLDQHSKKVMNRSMKVTQSLQGALINNTYNIKADWTDAYSYIKNVVTISSLYSKSPLLLKLLHLEDVNKPRQKSFFESLNAGMLFEYYDFHHRAFFKKNNVSNEETLNSLILQKYMLNNQGRPLRKYVKLENSNRLWLFRILFTELGSLDNISLRATSMNYYYRNKISLKQIFKLSTYQWWNWHLRKPLEQLGDVQDIAYFPCGDKYYNPRHRRWVLTNGFWSYWFSFDKNFYFDLYEQYMFESFQTAYLSLDENREILDYLAKLFIYLEKVSETELFLIFNRYKL